MAAVATHADWVRRAGELVPEGRAFVDGAFVAAAGGATFPSVSPRDGRVLAEVAACTAADVDRAVAAARAAFEDGRWRRRPPAERKAVMLRWAELLRARADELALLESLEVGKPITDAVAVDVAGAAGCVQWYGEAIDKLYGEVGPVREGALAVVTREPLGVVGAIVPWNYPLIIAAWKVAPAIATGNSVVLKPAEQSSLSALLLARTAVEAGLPPGVLNVVPGLGPVAGEALARHPGVDALAFTGSGETGAHLLSCSAASNAKPVELELGGKSAHVVLADCPDLDAAAEAVAWGIFYNAGQTCNAGSRLVVERPIAAELVERVVAIARGIVPGDPLDPATRLGALVSAEHLATVDGWVRRAESDGAVVACGGVPVEVVPGGAYYPPTVLTGVTNDQPVARHEVFGPVLAVIEADDPAHALAIANDSPYGLAGAVWTADLATAHWMARELRAGTVWVNTFDATDVSLPFGGFGASGHGRDKSLHALHACTRPKTTWIEHGRPAVAAAGAPRRTP